jgi:NYN domain
MISHTLFFNWTKSFFKKKLITVFLDGDQLSNKQLRQIIHKKKSVHYRLYYTNVQRRVTLFPDTVIIKVDNTFGKEALDKRLGIDIVEEVMNSNPTEVIVVSNDYDHLDSLSHIGKKYPSTKFFLATFNKSQMSLKFKFPMKEIPLNVSCTFIKFK